MEASENTNRRSERKRKRKESYSPEGKKEGCKKKAEGQNRTKLSSSRLCDVLPNGIIFMVDYLLYQFIWSTSVQNLTFSSESLRKYLSCHSMSDTVLLYKFQSNSCQIADWL